jgi:hypothetical protein
MRMLLATAAISSSLFACGKENAGVEAAREEAEAALKQKMDKGEVPKTLKPPVSGETKLDCTKVIDAAAFTTALGEKEPLTISDASKTEKEATAICNLMRGGKPLSAAEQTALTKKEGKLGVLPGEQAAADLKRSMSPFNGVRGDDTMGNFACVQVVPTGAFDAHVFRFFDADTKCIFEVRGGPSNQDNDMVRTCAKTARDTIGPTQIGK